MSVQEFSQLDESELNADLALLQADWSFLALTGEQTRTNLQTSAVTSGLPSQSTLIQGIVQYLAKRAKNEATVFYLDNLESHISKPPLSCLLPSANDALGAFPTVGYRQALPRLSRAFAEDLSQMPQHLADTTCIGNRTASWGWIRVGADLYNGISSSQHPVTMM